MTRAKSVALLRGINVGKAKRIAMADLREVFADLGCESVKTLLNSGNVVFAPAIGVKSPTVAMIERAIEARFHVASRVTVVGGSEFKAIVAANPLAAEGSKLLVGFYSSKAAAKRLGPLLEEDWGDESLALGNGAFYVSCPRGVLESRLMAEIGRVGRDDITTRNWNTVIKLERLL